MSVRLIDSQAELAALEPDWNRLWASCADGDIFQHFAWASAFATAFGLDRQLYVLTWSLDGRIAAILPMYRVTPGRLRMLGDPRSDYSDILCADEHARDALSAFLDRLGNDKSWYVLELRELPERNRLCRHLQAADAGGRTMNWQAASPCPGIAISANGVVDSLVRKKSLVRHDKAMNKRGPVELRVYRDWGDVEGYLEDMFSQHVSRWNSAGQRSIYEHEKEREFCRRYCAGLSEENLLHFSVLRCGEETMATHLGFSSNGVFTWYKPTFDINHARLSPGEVLIKKLLEHCADNGIRYFDFTRGDEAFKMRFATEVGQNLTMTTFSRKRDQLAFSARERLRKVIRPRETTADVGVRKAGRPKVGSG